MNKRCIAIYCFLLLSFSVYAQKTKAIIGGEINAFEFSSTKSAIVSKAAVVSAHPLASAVGAAIMKRGGNAYDAIIATQLVLAVVYPNAGNIGGGGFLLSRSAGGELIAIDYREKAPAAASRDMYLDEKGNAQNILSESGHLSCGVPGTVAGLFATLPYAKLPFKQLIQPAIDLAEKGYALTEREAKSFNELHNDFSTYSTMPSAFTKKAEWKAGDKFIQTELANTLKRIRDKGAAGFYEGETARLIVAEMKRAKGIITLEDLKKYTAKKRSAIQFDYRGYTVIGFPPPSSGGILLGQMLKMVEKFPLSSFGFQSKQSVQLMIEAERRAYADRAAHLGDPDFWKVPQSTLLSDAYIAERMKDYDATKASASKDVQAGTVHESEETTHISIMDEDGNMVAVTTTLNDSYGSKTVVGGAGFILNDEMDDFSIKPGVPNMYGAIGGEANAIAPGKRMLSSMTPTLVLKNNKPFIVVGTPGGTTIPTSVFQSIINVIDFGMSATDAVNKPKFHHQWLPDIVFTENNFSAETAQHLQAMGYKIEKRGNIGRTEMIIIMPDGKLDAAADSRGDDSVAGY